MTSVLNKLAWMEVYALKYGEYKAAEGTPHEKRAKAMLDLTHAKCLREGCTEADIRDMQHHVDNLRARAE